MGNNKSLSNPANTNKIVPSMVWLWCSNAYFERLNYTLNDFISLMGGTYKCSVHLMKSPM